MIFRTFLLFLAIGNLNKWTVWSVPQENMTICYSPQCVHLARVYLENIDLNADPCHNFYHYVCSKWKKAFKKPNYQQLWTANIASASRSRQKLRAILEEPNSTLSESVNLAKHQYNMCMQIPFLESSKPEVLKRFITNAGKWPMLFNETEELPQQFEWWRIDNYYLNVAGESAIFDFIFERGERNPNTILLKLTKLSSTFGVMKYLRFKHWSSEEQENYAQFLMLLVRNVGDNRPIRTRKLKNDVLDVISFRKRFQEMVSAIRREIYSEMSVEAFQDWYENKNQSVDGGYVDWREQIRVLLRINPHNAHFQSLITVKVPEKYISQLASLLSNTSSEVIANHIHLYFIERHLTLTSQLKQLLDLSINAGDVLSGEHARLYPRWEWCILNIWDHDMLENLSQLYVKRYFPEKFKAAVKDLVRKTQEVLREHIRNSTWLSTEEKNNTEDKLSSLKSMIGYPDWYDVSSPDGHELLGAYPMLPDAYVTEPDGLFILNHLSITAAYLQWPMYTPDMPYVIDFGSTVFVIGHELHHLFKTKTPPYSTNASIPWWPRSDCFINLYKKYKTADLRRLSLLGKIQLNSAVTLNEDIADAMGLKIAFEGFKRKLKEENGTCPILPGFETFGCERLFFIAFANTMCADITRGAQLKFYREENHSSQEVRVNGAVSNMREFVDAFNCKSNDRMMPEETCTVW